MFLLLFLSPSLSLFINISIYEVLKKPHCLRFDEGFASMFCTSVLAPSLAQGGASLGTIFVVRDTSNFAAPINLHVVVLLFSLAQGRRKHRSSTAQAPLPFCFSTSPLKEGERKEGREGRKKVREGYIYIYIKILDYRVRCLRT